MTLVEVVLGLALLGSLLVGLLLAKTALSRQRIEADRRLEAVRLCDALLSNWQAEGRPVPKRGTGIIGAQKQFRWSTNVARVQRVEQNSFDVVRLQVTDNAARNPKPLASLEIMLPEK